MTEQDILPANDLGDRTLREDTKDMPAQQTDSALRDAHQGIPALEMYHDLPDAPLNDCRVEIVPLDAIYVEGDQQDDELHDDLIKALAHSISLIGLQNPICVVANDIPEHPATYRLVSGRKRYAAFLQLQRTTIPAHILSYAETDSEQEVRTALATTEENLVRKHYSLIELCELLGESKALYERIHPTTQKGKAKKPKHSGTELITAPVPKPLAYLDVAAQQLGKSRGTVWKYLSIYKKLIQGHAQEFTALKQCDHPILSKVEDLLELAQSDDIEALTRLLCGLGMTPDDRKSKPCTLQEAQKRLEQYRARAGQGPSSGATSTTPPGPSSGHESNQSPDNGGGPGESQVDPTSAQDNGTDTPAMAQDEPQNPHAPQDYSSGSQPPAKTAYDTGDSGADPDNAAAMNGETQQGEKGLSLDAVLAEFTQSFQQHIDQHLYGGEALHTFRAEIIAEHHSLWVVVTSTLSQPPDVTDRPAQCPGWGLHNASAEICNSCVYKVRCEEAQTVAVGKED
jgi:hypothetical protein